eukprot:gene26358-20447_t
MGFHGRHQSGFAMTIACILLALIFSANGAASNVFATTATTTMHTAATVQLQASLSFSVPFEDPDSGLPSGVRRVIHHRKRRDEDCCVADYADCPGFACCKDDQSTCVSQSEKLKANTADSGSERCADLSAAVCACSQD